ncbi:MAG: oligosaccharide flippase family protein [Desulfosoma sp.]|uniref:oligosaccharide flippase family protein n=1 Tax=Desulfosoma sp. TaxID=2603217 RepID=UPI00404A9055
MVMTAGLGFRMAGQTMVFFLVGRALGIRAYGAYSAVLALAMTLGEFSGLGAATIMLRDISRNNTMFSVSWSHTLGSLVITAPALLAIYLVLARAMLPDQIPWVVVVCIGAAEILFSPMVFAAMQAYQGHDRMARAARMVLMPILPRVCAALTLALAPLPQAARLPFWAVFYLISAAASASYALWLLRRDFGASVQPCWKGLGQVLYHGWPFAFGGAAQKIYVDIDKVMLSRLASLDATGAYSAAYRMVDMACVPLMSFFSASAPRFFRAGHAGISSAAGYALRVVPLPMLYALAIGVGLYGLAALLPWLLGRAFAPATEALRWLAWLPLLTIPRRLMQTAFGVSGGQTTGLLVLASGAVLNVALNLWMIPLWGWWGAMLATYATEILMGGFLLTRILRDVRGTR